MASTSFPGHHYISVQCLEPMQPSCYQPESKANTQRRTQPAGRNNCHPHILYMCVKVRYMCKLYNIKYTVVLNKRQLLYHGQPVKTQ